MDSNQLILAAQGFSNRTRFRYELSNDEILTAASRGPHGSAGDTGDRFLLLESPGAGFYWSIDIVSYWFDFSHGAYATIDPGFKFGLTSGLADTLNLHFKSFWFQSYLTPNFLAIFAEANSQTLYDSVIGDAFQSVTKITNDPVTSEVYDLLANQAIYVFIDNNGNPLTGGNPLNRIVIELDAQRTQLAV